MTLSECSRAEQRPHMYQGTRSTRNDKCESWDIKQIFAACRYGVVYLATAKHDKKQLFAIKKFKTGRVSYVCSEGGGAAAAAAAVKPDFCAWGCFEVDLVLNPGLAKVRHTATASSAQDITACSSRVPSMQWHPGCWWHSRALAAACTTQCQRQAAPRYCPCLQPHLPPTLPCLTTPTAGGGWSVPHSHP
jgi:hypothetical protein